MFYIALFSVTEILFLLGEFFLKNKNKILVWIFGLLAIFILCYFAGVRDFSVGADVETYVVKANEIANSSTIEEYFNLTGGIMYGREKDENIPENVKKYCKDKKMNKNNFSRYIEQVNKKFDDENEQKQIKEIFKKYNLFNKKLSPEEKINIFKERLLKCLSENIPFINEKWRIANGDKNNAFASVYSCIVAALKNYSKTSIYNTSEIHKIIKDHEQEAKEKNLDKDEKRISCFEERKRN